MRWRRQFIRSTFIHPYPGTFLVHHPNQDLLHCRDSLAHTGGLHQRRMRHRCQRPDPDLSRLRVWRLLLAIRILVRPPSPRSTHPPLHLPSTLHNTQLTIPNSGRETAFCSTGCNPLFGTCTPTPAPGPICGVEGFASKEAYYASSFNLIDTTDVSTCAALCLAEPECKSYLFNPLLGNCAYLPQTLAEGDFIATSTTNQLFWERACAETAA